MLLPLILRPKPLVLIADDDRLLRTMAREVLEENGWDLREASDGEEALASFAEHRPDLLILDVEMPRRDGIAACRAIRERFPEDPTPILIVTAADDRASVDRAYEAGATDFASKPLNWALLAHRVRFLLRASRTLRELRRSESLLAESQRLAQLGHWAWNAATQEMTWSDEIYRIFGLDVGAVEPNVRNWWNLIHPDDRSAIRKQARAALERGGRFGAEHRVLTDGESVKHVHQRAERVEGPGGSWLVGTLQDVSEQRRAQEEIRYLANFDGLTGLANRRHFLGSLELALEQARAEGRQLALLYVDLDRFKRVNDSLGHAAGDEVLRQVAEVLRSHVRATDVVARLSRADEAAAVSRLGGDEFTILLGHVPGPETAGEVARRILRDLPVSVTAGGRSAAPTASVGIAVFPGDGEDADSLMKAADAAMYHAKESGRNGYQFFCPSMNVESARKLHVDAALRRALDRDALELHYQPRIDLATGRPVGFEALLRWHDPELGRVPAIEAVKVAEEGGLISELGEMNFRKVCRQIRAWRARGLKALPVAVNVAPQQFERGDLCASIAATLQETGVEPALLEIEITERAFLQNSERVSLQLRDLRAIGVRVALDDFGTGYSSLSYLARLPVDMLKLDRSFVRDADCDPGGLIRCVVEMGHGLGLAVVAEGVDSDEQAAALSAMGCDQMQGFLISPAVPADQAVAFLEAAATGRGPAGGGPARGARAR